jgi:hypothetical protein
LKLKTAETLEEYSDRQREYDKLLPHLRIRHLLLEKMESSRSYRRKGWSLSGKRAV